jgi:hypothetical protein
MQFRKTRKSIRIRRMKMITVINQKRMRMRIIKMKMKWIQIKMCTTR